MLPSGATEFNDYDGRGLKTHSYTRLADNSIANEFYFTYGPWDRVDTVRNARAIGLGQVYSARMEYNGRHQVTKVHYPATGDGVADPTVTYEYDKYGNCTAITDELGHRRTFEYDEYRRCTRYTEPLNAPNWNGLGNVASRSWT